MTSQVSAPYLNGLTDRMIRAFASLDVVWVPFLKREAGSSILKRETAVSRNCSRSEAWSTSK
jgi:hypothetical protein